MQTVKQIWGWGGGVRLSFGLGEFAVGSMGRLL